MQLLPSIDDGTGSMTEPVAVLVVDDFSYPGVSHGYLVKEVIDDQAALLADEGIHIDTYAVDVSGPDVNYRMDNLATEIDDTITNLSSTHDRFVINMSFAAIPCTDTTTGFNFDTFQEEFEKNQSEEDGEATYNLEQYIGEEVDTEEDGGEEEDGEGDGDGDSSSSTSPEADYLTSLMTDTSYNTAMADLQTLLAGYISEDPNQRIIIPVASAGNFAHWYSAAPFAPARWSETISVSASKGFDDAMWNNQSDAMWQYSQPGDITMPGAWYHFDDGSFRTGTSFAAPFASMATALYLTYPYDANFPCTLGEESGLPLNSTESGWSDDWFFSGPLACSIDDTPYTSTADAPLTFDKTASTTTPAEGDTVTFTLTVTNTGTETATRVKALDEAAGVTGLTFVSAQTATGTYNPSNGIWWVGELAPGETATLTIDVQIDAGTSGTDIITTTETVLSDQLDAALSDSITLSVQ